MAARIAKRMTKYRVGERILNRVASIIEGKPVFRIIENGMSIDAHSFRVRNPSRYAGVFNKGERVLYIHFNITDKETGEKALQKLGREFPEMKKQGFSGIFGDSPNPVVLRQFEQLGNKLGLKSAYLDTPFPAGFFATARYRQNAKENSYPKRYQGNKPRRLAIRFFDA